MQLYGPDRPIAHSNKYVVFDIDHTLVHSHESINRFCDKQYLYNPKCRSSMYLVNMETDHSRRLTEAPQLWGEFRPGTREFLDFCQQYFQGIIIWSAGCRPYVEDMCRILFQGLQPPLMILAFEDCTMLPNDGYHKPLATIWSQIPQMNPQNTIIVDDRIENFIDNPSNGILIPPYNSGMTHDRALYQLQNWLVLPEVMMAPDIRQVQKPVFVK